MSLTTAHLSEYPMGECTLFFSWNAPTNIAIDAISHYIVSVNNGQKITSFAVNNTNNVILLSTSYAVYTCTTYNVSVRAVDRCGREGSPSRNITVSPESPRCDSASCMNNRRNTVGKHNHQRDSSCFISVVQTIGLVDQGCSTAAYVLFALVVAGVLVCIIIIVTTIIIIIKCRPNKKVHIQV